MFYDGVVPKLIPVVILTVLMTGCVERKLSIRTEPSGARAYMDYDLKGQTPVEVDFTHYGSRFVRLEKRGYRTTLSTFDIDPTWYSYFPINFFTEVLSPFTITDRRELYYELDAEALPADRERPDREQDREEIQKRAEKLQKEAPGSPSSSEE